MHRPDWLDDTAKEFWRKHYKTLNLGDEHAEGFAVLCQTYSDYRHATDLRAKTKYLDYFLKQCREYKLTPKSSPKKTETTSIPDDIDRYLKGA